MAAPLDTALCAVLGVLLPAAAASAASLPVVLAHSRWMAASVERALRRAASGDGDGGDGWAAVVSGCSALVEVFGKVPSLDTSEHGAGAAAAAAAAAALLAGAGAASMKAVDSEALSEGVGAAADRCERLQRALLLLLTKRAHGAARLRWSQRALLDALTALRSMPAVQLPAAAAIASLSPLIGARSSPVRFGALALFERLQSAEAEAGAAAASEEGAEEEGDADEPLPLRFLFGGAAQTVAGRRAAADGEAMVALDRLEELMGDAADAEARMLAWSAALALLAHARPTAAARVSAGWKHSGLPGFLNETLLPLLPLARPPPGSGAASLAAPTSLGESDPPPGAAEVAVAVFAALLSRVPALARHWYTSELSRAAHAAVARYTELHVTPALLRREAEAISAAPSSGDDFVVKASIGARSVTATYSYEGTYMQIVLRLDRAHPLRAVEVECTQRAGVSDARWRKWQRTISTMLLAQNGSLRDALALFKENVDRVFEGEGERGAPRRVMTACQP